MNALGFRHIRVRLAVLNLVVFGGILVLYAFGTSWFFLSTLNHQMDGSLKEEVELVEQMLLHSPDGSYPPDIHDENIHELERFLEIWSFDGRLLYRSKALGANALGGMPDTTRLHSIVVTRSQLLSDGTRMRVAEKQHTGSSPRVIRLAVSEAGYLADIQKLVTVLLIGTPVALLLVLVCAYLMAHRALKPIDLMASTARRMGADSLAGRIPVTNPDDELGRLAAAFNELLSRVERSFVQLRQFTSDASHELRTPLTAMRSVGEVGLQVGRTSAEYREVIGSMLEESNRLTKLVDSLLFLARADSGKHQLHKENLDLFTFARETAGLVSVLAEEKQQTLEITGQPGLIVSADRTLLCQALLNVVDNAIKFSPELSAINVKVGSNGEHHGFIDVTDSGPGIPPAEQKRVFERFYRLNNNATGGSGLGLAIARWAVEANGGTITMESVEGSGSTFHISLPSTSPGSAQS